LGRIATDHTRDEIITGGSRNLATWREHPGFCTGDIIAGGE